MHSNTSYHHELAFDKYYSRETQSIAIIFLPFSTNLNADFLILIEVLTKVRVSHCECARTDSYGLNWQLSVGIS